jgi:hypothetical protein
MLEETDFPRRKANVRGSYLAAVGYLRISRHTASQKRVPSASRLSPTPAGFKETTKNVIRSFERRSKIKYSLQDIPRDSKKYPCGFEQGKIKSSTVIRRISKVQRFRIRIQETRHEERRCHGFFCQQNAGH